ncbi:Hsp70 family protein [Pseudanabaena sp. PCC 6802]|uniref:Hsp70 family protein n=1 Tax=Pseudanabaena sp. PCC 6802 TaxID=118173 RepID=UPI0003695618|nr:Hsp70 family protein [Pseudanabaena sp. PCC 6802]
MSRTVGIDLGTTNSEVAIVENGQARILPGEDGDLMLPSCVGFSNTGKLIVGREALRQYAAAPERTVRSIKRWMGTDHTTTLRVGGTGSEETRDYLPHEISAMILRSLKQRAESALGEEVTQAVITVPAYFTDAQRQATKTAGEIAGFEVLQIVNEPTAAALAYDVRSEETERVLVYDLGGGTFDVSVVEITGAVTEVLASHGNNRLGGDDFDRRLQLHLAELFHQTHDVSVPDDAATQARLLQSAEQIKIELSSHAFAPVKEAFLGTKGKTALHLETEIARSDFEDLIRPLLEETLEAIDRALADANLVATDLDRVILVGGSTRVPLVQEMVAAHLGQLPVDGIQPDLCVALGAALQAGVLAGEDVESILVDVIPHSLGISAAVMTPMGLMPGFFSVIIPRNSVVPVSRSEVYSTVSPNQPMVRIEVFQGENQHAEENVPLGAYTIEDIPPGPAGSIKIEVHFDFDLNGILTVTTTEKAKGQKVKLVVENTAGVQKLSSQDLKQARADLESLFMEEDEMFNVDVEDSSSTEIDSELEKLFVQARSLLDVLEVEQADELQDLLDRMEQAIADGTMATIAQIREELADFVYYANSNL